MSANFFGFKQETSVPIETMEPGTEIKEDEDSPETVASVVTPTSTPVEVKEDLEDYALKTADDFETKIFPVVGEYLRNQGTSD